MPATTQPNGTLPVTTQGQDVAASIDRLGARIVQAAETVAAPLWAVSIALGSVAAAIRPPRHVVGDHEGAQ